MATSRRADLGIALIDEVLRAQGRLRSAARYLSGGEVGNLHMTVLASVRMATTPPTVSQIARSLGYARQVIQRVADALAERELVAFVDNPAHKRARRLVVTESGREVHDAATVRSRAWVERVTADLDVSELAAAVETLRTIRHRMEDAVRADDAVRTDDPLSTAPSI